MFNKLVVGVEFSAHSDRAVAAAVKLAKVSGGTVVLVHVLPPSAEVGRSGSAEICNAMQQRLGDLSARIAGEHGIKVDWGLVDGDSARELNRYVELWGGDALVVGSADRSALGRFLVGSVAEALVHISKVPVVVIGPNA